MAAFMTKKMQFEPSIKREHRLMLGQFKVEKWSTTAIFDKRTIYYYELYYNKWYFEGTEPFLKDRKHCFACGSPLMAAYMTKFQEDSISQKYLCCECFPKIRRSKKHKIQIVTNYEEFLNAKKTKKNI
jgi:hypothetical protein